MPRFSLNMIGRLVLYGLLAVFTAGVLVLGQSALWLPDVSVGMKVVLVAMATLAAYRPQHALLALAVLAPLGRLLTSELGSRMRATEGLVLAFLLGALLRGWRNGTFRDYPSNALEIAALVFGLIVAGSAAEQIWLLQLQRDFPWPFLQTLGDYATYQYLGAQRSFGMIFHAMLLLEGAALLIITARVCRIQPAFAWRLTLMLVLGATATAVANLTEVIAEWRAGALAVGDFLRHVGSARRSAYIPDLNAAGSLFAMNAAIALCMVAIGGRRALVWLIPAIIIGAGFWLAGSRTAMVAAVLIAAVSVAAALLRRRTTARRAALAMILLAGLVISALLYFPSGFFSDTAKYVVTTRWMFLGTTLRMVLAHPLTGVGIGQYFHWSYHFSSPELQALHPQRENAHNNFAQIAGEMGLPGLLAFVMLLVFALWYWRREGKTSENVLTPIVLGLAVFMLTWLGGHPLLVPEVAFPFWIALAIVAAVAPIQSIRIPDLTIGISALLVVIAVSLPWRTKVKAADIDFARVSYGFSNWFEPSGVRARRADTRARLFIPSNADRLAIPLQARAVSENNPVELSLLVNGQLVEQIRFVDIAWRTVDLALPPTTERYHSVDFEISRPSIPEGVSERSPRRRLGVYVGEVVSSGGVQSR